MLTQTAKGHRVASRTPRPRQPDNARQPLWRWLPLLLIVVGAAAFFALGLHRYLSLDALRQHSRQLTGWIGDHHILAVLVFIAAYATLIVIVPPSGAITSVAGGFLFGPVLGTILVVIGATLGATVIFLATRISLGDFLRRRGGTRLRSALGKMAAGFAENELGYMLTLRLVPLFPFWLVNIAPALLGVRPRIFILATFFGIIPGSVVFTTFGAGLDDIFASGQPISLDSVLSPRIVGAMLGLALLSLLPGLYRKFKERGGPPQGDKA